MQHEGLRFSVLDVIRAMAHVFGGVHNQLPESEGEHRLLQLAKQMKTENMPVPHSVIKDIALVTVQGVLPVVGAIAERYRAAALLSSSKLRFTGATRSPFRRPA